MPCLPVVSDTNAGPSRVGAKSQEAALGYLKHLQHHLACNAFGYTSSLAVQTMEEPCRALCPDEVARMCSNLACGSRQRQERCLCYGARLMGGTQIEISRLTFMGTLTNDAI